MSRRNKEFELNHKGLYAVIAIGIFIFGVFIFLIGAGFVNMVKEKKEEARISQNEISSSETFSEEETDVTNFGTKIVISNLEEYAVPMLEEKAELLEYELYEYAERNFLEETTGNIFHVMIPEENDSLLFFFCKFSNSNEIVQLVYDTEKEFLIALKSYYTEEEIINEIWNGVCPTDRDMEE